MRPLILVSNDDGIDAAGIRAMEAVAREFGDVIVSAPALEQSGTSQALTFRSSLRVHNKSEGRYAVTGTPADSVYLGILHLCPRTPDLVLAGVNHGFNLGTDVYYSGTVGAAREGRMRGATALAVSVEHGADPNLAIPFIRKVVPGLLRGVTQGHRTLMNLNVPEKPESDEIIVTRLGTRRYEDQVQARLDLQGREYYWIGGPPLASDDGPGFDTHEVARGRTSLTIMGLELRAPDQEAWCERLGFGLES